MTLEEPDQQDPLQSLIANILEAESRGEPVDRKEMLDQHPEHADSLREFFAVHDRLRSARTLDDPTIPPGDRPIEESTIPPLQEPDALTIAPAEPVKSGDATVGDKVRYFGDYELLEEIARGGMGVVFKARQINLNRLVALKMILSGEFAGEDDINRFHIEAEAAAQLDHPNIVPIFEIGEHHGQHYFSMGYVEGESLADKVSEGPIPPREAAEIVKKVCDAMKFAHERGVIHRDLKPANVLIDRNGQPKVTDFGLAKKTGADSNLTGTGQILGTPAYMPPEQASGKSDVGPLADVYSIGAILYCLLTGRPPFQAASPMETLLQVLEKEAASPRLINPSIPVDLETICLKCLSKQANDRYGTAQELSSDLQRFLNQEPILARPVGGLERGWRWCMRNPIIASLGAAVVLLLITGITVSSSLGLLAIDRAQEAERSMNFAQKRHYFAEMSLSYEDLKRGATESLRARLEEHTPGPDEGDLRDWEWNFLNSQLQQELKTIVSGKPAVTTVDVANQHQMVAVGFANGQIQFLDLSTGVLLRTIDGESQIDCLKWSPTGDRLCYCAATGVVHILDDPIHGKPQRLTEFAGKSCVLDWSPDGSALVVGTSDGRVALVSTETGSYLFDQFSGPIISVDWHPSDPQIAVTFNGIPSGAFGRLDLSIIDASNLERTKSLMGVAIDTLPKSLAWHHSGKYLAVGGTSGTVIIYRTDTYETIAEVQIDAKHVDSFAWKPDTEFGFAAVGSSNAVKYYHSFDHQSTLIGHSNVVSSLNFCSPELIVSGSHDGSVRTWQTTAFGATIVDGFKNWISSVSFHPHDNNLLLVSDLLSDAHVVNLATRRRDTLRGQGKIWQAIWSPNGDHAAVVGFGRSVAIFDWPGQEDSTPSVATLEQSSRHDSNYAVNEARNSPLSVLLPTKRIEGHRENIRNIHWSPDAEFFITCADNEALVQNLSGQIKKRLTGYASAFVAAGWSPDGETLALKDKSSVRFINTQSFAERFVVDCEGSIECMKWSPDSKQLAVGDASGRLSIWSIETQSKVHDLPLHSNLVTGISWSPSGKRLATSSHDHTVKIVDAETGVTILSFTSRLGRAHCVDWSSDGSRIAVGFWNRGASEDSSVCVWNATKQSVSDTATDTQANVLPSNGMPDRKAIDSGAIAGWKRFDAISGEGLLVEQKKLAVLTEVIEKQLSLFEAMSKARPNEDLWHIAHARHLVSQRRWYEATISYAKGSTKETSALLLFEYAAAALLSRRREDYARALELLETNSNASESRLSNNAIGLASALAKGEKFDSDESLQIVEVLKQDHILGGQFQARGLAWIRAGRYDQALQLLSRSASSGLHSESSDILLCLLNLKKKRFDEAIDCRRRVQTWILESNTGSSTARRLQDTARWLTLHLLIRECDDLLCDTVIDTAAQGQNNTARARQQFRSIAQILDISDRLVIARKYLDACESAQLFSMFPKGEAGGESNVNLVMRPSFEFVSANGSLPWGWYRSIVSSPKDGYRCETVTHEARSGSRSLRIVGSGGYGFVKCDRLGLDRDRKYRAEIWVKSSDSRIANANLRICYFDLENKYLGMCSSSHAANRSDWQRISVTGQSYKFPKAKYVTVELWLLGQGDVLFDDICLFMDGSEAEVPDYLQNGDMEDLAGNAPSGWNVQILDGDQANFWVDRTITFAGEYSGWLTGSGNCYASSQPVVPRTDQEYELTGQVFTRKGVAKVAISYFMDEKLLGKSESKPLSETDWQTANLRTELAAYPNATHFQVNLMGEGEFDVRFDEFKLTAFARE